MPIHKRTGPVPLGNEVRIEVSISPALASTLAVLVELSGMSRSAVVRAALTDFARSTGVVLSSEADPTPTRRKFHTINTKEES